MLELIKINEETKIDLQHNTTKEWTEYRIGRYTVDHIVYTNENGYSTTRISVTKDWDSEYLPTIYYENMFDSDEDKYFTIQTTAYGAKKPDEIKYIMAGYQEAIEVVKVLTENFIK